MPTFVLTLETPDLSEDDFWRVRVEGDPGYVIEATDLGALLDNLLKWLRDRG